VSNATYINSIDYLTKYLQTNPWLDINNTNKCSWTDTSLSDPNPRFIRAASGARGLENLSRQSDPIAITKESVFKVLNCASLIYSHNDNIVFDTKWQVAYDINNKKVYWRDVKLSESGQGPVCYNKQVPKNQIQIILIVLKRYQYHQVN